MLPGESFVELTLLGGVLALEGTAVGQFMFSRPLVAGTLAGLLLGSPAEGFALGALLEIYLLVAFPVGGARFPEGALATVVGVASLGPGGAGETALAVAVALVWGQVAGVSITLQRNLNGRLFVPDDESAGATTVTRGHLLALAAEFVRGAVVTALGVVAGRGVVSALAAYWPLDAPTTRGVLLLGGLVSLGVLLRSLGGLRRRLGLLSAGLGVGILMGYLL